MGDMQTLSSLQQTVGSLGEKIPLSEKVSKTYSVNNERFSESYSRRESTSFPSQISIRSPLTNPIAITSLCFSLFAV